MKLVNGKMIVDIVLHRGVTIRVNGQEPNNPWSTGAGDDESVYLSDDLTIDDMKITKIDFHHNVNAGEPEKLIKMTLWTSQGNFTGPRTKNIWFEEEELADAWNKDEEVYTEFHGGEKYPMDDMCWHLQYELEPVEVAEKIRS